MDTNLSELKLDPVGYSVRINFLNGGAAGFWKQNMNQALMEIMEHVKRSDLIVTQIIIQRNKYSNRMNV